MPEIESYLGDLNKLQYLLYAEKKHSLLIVLQGLDAGGKDGVVRHVMTGMNPAACRVVGFKQPTADELAHDFLWRIQPHVPNKGEVAIFNRSHYEDVLVVRVHEIVSKKIWSRRYDLINDFERLLAVENNTTILKFFLYILEGRAVSPLQTAGLDDPGGNGRSANRTTRSGNTGTPTSTLSRPCCARPAPSTPRGSSSPQRIKTVPRFGHPAR